MSCVNIRNTLQHAATHCNTLQHTCNPVTVARHSCVSIDWFWLRNWLINKGAIYTGTPPLFWNFISLFERPRTRLAGKIQIQNQSIQLNLSCRAYLTCLNTEESRKLRRARNIMSSSRQISQFFPTNSWIEITQSIMSCVFDVLKHGGE